MRRSIKNGYASVLVMLLLAVGFTLSAWLFTALGNATAMTRNELSAANAMSAAESGLAATLHELRCVSNETGFRGDESEILKGLSAAVLARSLSEDQGTIAGTVSLESSGLGFSTSAVTLDGLGSYVVHMTLSQKFDNGYTVRVQGSSGAAKREICVELDAKLVFGSSSMDYPIVSMRELSLPNERNEDAGIFRFDGTTGEPVETDKGTVAGDSPYYLRFQDSPIPDPNADPLLPPKFLDDEVYSTLTALARSNVLERLDETSLMGTQFGSVYIPPSSGTVAFPPNCTIDGIVYVGWPNSISLGDVTINGMIIYEKPPAGYLADPVDPTKPSPSVIKLDRTNVITARPLAEGSIDSLLVSAGYVTETEQKRFTDLLGEWAIHAPETDLDPDNGNTTGERTFEGNFHIRDLGKSTGDGDASVSNLIIRGQILCEGGVDLGGNRVFCIEPPDVTDNENALRRVSLNQQHGGYWEP